MVEYLSGERVQASSALPITVGTEFNLRFDYEVDSYPAGTGASGNYGIFSKDNTTGANTGGQDFVVLANNDGVKHKLAIGKNTSPYGGSGVSGSSWIDLVVGTQYYVEIVGNGDDTYTLSIRTGSHSGSHVSGSPQTVDASSLDSVANLDYFGFKNTTGGGNGGTVTLTDNLALYNGTTSASGTASFTDDFANDSGWTFTTSEVEITGGKLEVTMNRTNNDSATEKFETNEIDDITNVPSGTRLEDTATRKIYRMTDNAISTANLKCYWTLGQASGDIPNSASTIGSSTAIADSELEKLGGDADDYRHAGHIPNTYSFNFDNSDGERLIASNASTSDWEFITNSGAVFTIAWWMKIDNNAAILDFLGTGGSGSPDFTIRYRGNVDDKFAFFFSTEGELFDSSSITTSDTNWHFYTVTYDDSVGTLTHTKDNTTTWTETGLDLTSTSTPTTANFALGDAGGSDKAMSGLMQEVSVWNRVLTSAEQTILYNSGTGKILGKHWAERGVSS